VPLLGSQLMAKLGASLPTSTDEVRYCCPFCVIRGKSPDSKYHLYINVVKEKFRCWRCGVKGPYEYLLRLLRLPREVAIIEDVRGQLDSVDRDDVPGELTEIPWPVGYRLLSPGDLAWEYLLGRGVSVEQIRDYQIGVAQVDLYRRIYFPGFDAAGSLVFLVSRNYIYDEEPRYLNVGLRGVRRRFVWNLQRITSERLNTLSVCEGPISAMVSGRSGVATLGKVVTGLQCSEILRASVSRIYIELDGDAREEAFRLWCQLGSRRDGVYLVPLGLDDNGRKEDPASLAPGEMSERRRSAWLYSEAQALRVRLEAVYGCSRASG